MFEHLHMCWYFFNYLNVLILRKISSTTFFFIIAKVKYYCVEDGWKKIEMGYAIAWLSRDIVYIKLPLLFKQVGSWCSNVFNWIVDTEGHSKVRSTNFSAHTWLLPFKKKDKTLPSKGSEGCQGLQLWRGFHFGLEICLPQGLLIQACFTEFSQVNCWSGV